MPPALAIARADGAPALQTSGEPGRQYVVEYPLGLSASDTWTALPAFALTNSPQSFVDHSATTATQRHYRARRLC